MDSMVWYKQKVQTKFVFYYPKDKKPKTESAFKGF